MGVLFFEHLGGDKFYVCSECGVYITNRNLLISSRFTSGSGPALLFHKVVNVEYGKVELKSLMTGPHFLRDVYCKRCGLRLGWYYEYTSVKRLRYKEGKTILEKSVVIEQLDDDQTDYGDS